MTKLLTDNFKTHIAAQYLESISESSNSLYYAFAARSLEFEDDNNPPNPNNNIQNIHYDLYDEMIFGKKITASDAKHSVKKIEWQSGNTFSQYDSSVDNLANTDFYVVSQEGSNYYVFKCLDNNGNSVANDQPLFSETSAEDEFYQTSDGYQWKYLYSISSSEWSKFSTSNFIPVILDSNVSANAVDGSIETIRISDGGTSYNSYANGLIKEAAVSGNTLLFSLEGDPSITLSSNADFYKNCNFYIRSGTGAGQIKTVSEYIVSGSERRVLLDQEFSTLPDTTSVWEIKPGISIIGDGSGAEALASINTSSNTVNSVEIISRGSNYSYATVSITGNNGSTQANDAIAYAVMSPPGGHGANTISELGAKWIVIGTQFSNNESNTIPVSNDYRKIGLIKDPLFANIELTLTTSTASSFNDGETVIHYNTQASNTLIKTYTYTLSRYQTLNVSSNTGFAENDSVSFENKAGTILSVESNNIFVRLSSSSDAFAVSDKISDATITKTVDSISAANPAVVVTSNTHGISNGTAIIFYGLDGTALDDDTTPTTYYAKTVNTTAFQVFTDSGLSTGFDNSSNTAATEGFISNGTAIANVITAAYTFTGNNDPISGKDDAGEIFGTVANTGHDTPISLRTKYNGTEFDSTHEANNFTLTNITLNPASDVIISELYSPVETILEVDYVGRTTAEVSNRSGSVLRLRNVRGSFETGYQIKGLTSGTIATIESLDRSFDTFNQLTEMTVEITSTGSVSGIGETGFSYDMLVEQSDTNSSGYIHSMANTVTRQIANITAANPAVVTTTVSHGYSNSTSITFNNLNGTALDANTPTAYYVQTVNTISFQVFTDSGLSTAFDNSANTVANNGTVTSSANTSNVNKTFYLNNVKGVFSESDDASGTINNFSSNTGAVAKIKTRTDGDLVDNSGEIIYVENMQPIARSEEQTEKIKLVLEF